MRQFLSSLVAALLFQATNVSADTHINPLLSLGIPPTAELKSTLDTYPQSFAIEVGHDGYVYVGGNTGVSVFDGEHWQLIEMPNGKLVRSLSKGPNDTIFVGGYDIFGQISRIDTGALIFTDLSAEVQGVREAGFADIWDLIVTEEAVFFKAVKDLFRYDLTTKHLEHWQHEARFGAINELNHEVYVQFRELGLAKYDSGSFELVSQDPLWHEQIYDLVPLHDGSWLGNTRSGVWLHVENTRVGSEQNWLVPKPIEIKGLPTGDEFYDVTDIGTGRIGMAHKSGAVFVLHWPDQRVEELPVSQDMLIEIDALVDEALFTLTDQAVIRLSWPSPWRLLTPDSGLRGRVHNIREWREQWFVLSGSGTFRLLPDNMRAFEKLSWTNHEAWDLLPLSEDEALLANSYQLMLITPDTARDISHDALYPRLLQNSKSHSNTVLIGTELGFAIWNREQGFLIDWSELGTLVHSIVELNPTELLLGTQHRGVVHVTLSEQLNSVQDIRFLGEAEGITYGIEGEGILNQVGERIFASTNKGIYLWEQAKFSEFPSRLAEVMEPIQAVRVEAGAHGEYWAYSHNRLYYLPASQSGSSAWQKIELNGLIPGAISALYAQSRESQAVILGANSSLIIYQPELSLPPQSSPQVNLTSVQHIVDGEVTRLNLLESYQFPEQNSALRFSFSLPTAAPSEQNLYRARLDGYEDHFSEWGRSTQITYSNLQPGEYAFIVRAKTLTGEESETTPFRFIITPPWHQSISAQITFIAIALLTLWQIIRYLTKRRTRLLAAERKRLKIMVEERTAELATANKKLESMANVDGLTGIANRRRLDQYLLSCVQQSSVSQKPLALLLIDVDHFKEFNDTHGHLAGDNALREVAQRIQDCLRRQDDLAARYGGEEFAVVMPGAERQHAFAVAECIRDTVQRTVKDISVSVGVAVFETQHQDIDTSIETLISQADQALYRAKRGGRNQVQ
ncbi:MAG: GGDEF domain protein [Idiomarinaceae bacterium HL-53]|nr:MAG: GGDEF domain protein [Idiomarinaceae bacterium HL-53]CUS47739.1 diguanylate cyclase (GGDEF) domain-containing protein [Idiomarinaceae bacterium HL-53]